jgi:hypothetical protein
MLKGLSKDQLPGFIREHMEFRKAFYNLAKLRVEGEDPDMDELLGIIRQLAT